MEAPAMHIGVVSKRTGLSIDAIRFYEKQRLLSVPVRSEGGYRLFREEDVGSIEFIKSAQELGFTLAEIRELLPLRREEVEPCPKVQRLLEAKLAAVRSKIAALHALQEELQAALRKCNRAMRSARTRPAQSCPVLEDISRNRARRRRP